MTAQRWTLLFTNVYGAVGGIPTFNRELVSALAAIAPARGWSVRVLALNDPGDGAAAPAGVTYQAFGGKRGRFVVEALRAFGRSERVVFGHAHFLPLALWGTEARCWLVAHGIEMWDPLCGPRAWGLGRMNRVLCVSRFTRERLIQNHGIAEDRLAIFPNTAQPPSGVGRGEWGVGGEGHPSLLLTVSRLWPEERYKKIDRMIEAMPGVLKAFPNTEYVIAGDGGDRPRLERLAKELGVGARVRFAGALSEEELGRLYAACDVFVLPSLGEGFGIVFLEAMAWGKPCIGADAGGIADVIDHGRTGFRVAPDSASALESAVVRLLGDEGLRRAMGDAGRDRFLADFSPERFRSRLSRLAEAA